MCLKVAGVLFLLVALGHVVRMVMGWTVIVGTFTVPMWMSVVVIVVGVALGVCMLMCSCCKGESDAAAPPQPKA
jgi:uncharacterized membrane protein YccC